MRARTLLMALLVAYVLLLLLVVHYEQLESRHSNTHAAVRHSRHCSPAPLRCHQHPLRAAWYNQASTAAASLTVPQHAAVATSRAALQAYLDSPAFAAAAAAAAAHQLQQQQQQQGASGSSEDWRRGILVVAGGRKLLTHLVVMLKVLRETLGCTLPVEVAWLGPQEMDNATLATLQHKFGPLRGFDVQAMPYPAALPRVPLKQWVGKVAALLHCTFQEVLLLDSDNLPLSDPSYLFADALYKQHGNLFWPDFWSDWVKPGVYPWLGINRTVVQPQLEAGAGFTGRDAESGMVLLDRRRWLKVLYLTFYINTYHKQLYYRVVHGDKDTFALAFALAGQADKYRQVSVLPGGVFRWGKDQLEVKPTRERPQASTTDGWQLLGALQYDDTGRPAFFHRTMNKLSPDEEPWPAELVTGPLPTQWLQYFLAHDSKGPTKGVWWEHVAPDTAFELIAQSNATVLSSAGPDQHTGSSSSSIRSCTRQLFELYKAAQLAALPVDYQPVLECACSHLNAGQAVQSSPSLSAAAGSGAQPVKAALVEPSLVQLSTPLQIIEASLEALRWLKETEGRAAFPALAPGSALA